MMVHIYSYIFADKAKNNNRNENVLEVFIVDKNDDPWPDKIKLLFNTKCPGMRHFTGQICSVSKQISGVCEKIN